MAYKLVVFDFDGTLANSFPWIASVIDQVAEQFHIKRVANLDLETLRGMHAREMIRMHRLPFWKFPLIARHVNKRMKNEIHQVTLFDGVDFLLQCLANHGIKLAMVTSNSYENVQLVLGQKNASLIQYYECGVPLFRKPRRIQKVIKKCGVQPAETLCIGDEIRDLEAAQKVKAAFGAVSWGFTRVDALKAHEPHMVFNSMNEIAEVITQQACI